MNLNPQKANVQKTKKPQLSILLTLTVCESGEDGARTHDLLAASQTL